MAHLGQVDQWEDIQQRSLLATRFSVSLDLSTHSDPHSRTHTYPGASHGLAQLAPHKDQFNADLLAFPREG
jgi:hypothetical protein